MTVAVLETTARRLDRILAHEQVAARAPSLGAGVVRGGELCWTGVRGTTARLGGPAPSSQDTQYRIESITKTLTAVLLLLLQLRDAGALSLDDRLDAHLPGLPTAAAPCVSYSPTHRDCRRHRRGRGGSASRASRSVSHLECASFIYTRVPYDVEAPIPG